MLAHLRIGLDCIGIKQRQGVLGGPIAIPCPALPCSAPAVMTESCKAHRAVLFRVSVLSEARVSLPDSLMCT